VAQTDLQIANYLKTVLPNLWAFCMHTLAAVYAVSVQDLTAASQPIAQLGLLAEAQTGLAGEPIPDQVSLLVSARGAMARKGQNARMFIPFPGTLMITPGTGNVSTSAQLGLGSIAAATYGAVDAGSGTGTIVLAGVIRHKAQPQRISKARPGRRNYGSTLPATGLAYFAISSFQASLQWATQKRRSERKRTNPPPP
jgi:hypothetical protein